MALTIALTCALMAFVVFLLHRLQKSNSKAITEAPTEFIVANRKFRRAVKKQYNVELPLKITKGEWLFWASRLK